MGVYLDHNATSPASAEHLAQVFSRLQSAAGNPSSPHSAGRSASVALTESRKLVAASVDAEPGEVVFVSGGSEANNLATAGVLRALARPLNEVHAVTTSIEHPSVLEPLRYLEETSGLQLTVLPVDETGRVSCADVVKSLRTNTALVSMMVANNETGAIQPTFEFAQWLNQARWVKPKPGQEWRTSSAPQWPAWANELNGAIGQTDLQNIHFHVDAVQAYGKLLKQEWCSIGYDSFSLCAHKLGGLAGVGALVLRRGRKFEPLIRGGAQERSRRAGTENLAGVLSIGKIAHEISGDEWWREMQAVDERRRKLLDKLMSLPGLLLNSGRETCLPNTVNLCVEHAVLRGEDLLVELDLRGFYASSGSACSSAANRPSHVLLAQGRTHSQARNGVRISLGRKTSEEEIAALIFALSEIFQRH